MLDLEDIMYAQLQEARRTAIQFLVSTVIAIIGYFVSDVFSTTAVTDPLNILMLRLITFSVVTGIYAIVVWDVLHPYFFNLPRRYNRASKRFFDKLRDCSLEQPKDLLGICVDALNSGVDLSSVNNTIATDFDNCRVILFRANIKDAPLVFKLLDKNGKTLASIPTV